MSGGRRSKLSPSLFPFLAVLICTLGTLILLLALVAEKATDAAAVASASEAEIETADAASLGPARPGLAATAVSSMIEEEEFLVAQLVSVRQAQTDDIEQRRDKLAHVEEHTRRLTDELKRLSDEVDRATQQQSADSEITDEQLAILKQEIEIEEREIEEKLAESGTRKPRVIIVPHKGPNGTDRRPVYLECTEDALVIWPEEVRISIDQLQQSDAGANPVESALRVIRNHAMTQYGDSVPPYPLLIVRPDGILTYASARGAMKDYDDQFGYELVPTDIELATSKPDTNLKRKIDRAITEAIANQTRLELIAQRNNISSGRRLPVLSAAALDRQGRSSGYRSLGRNEQNLYTEQANDARSIARSYADDRADSRSKSPSVTYGNSNNYGQQSAQVNANTNPGGIDPAMDQKWSEDMRQAAGELSGRSLDGSGAFDENGNPRSLMDSYLQGAGQQSGSEGKPSDFNSEFAGADGNTDQVEQPNGLSGAGGEMNEGKKPNQNPYEASGGSAGAGQPQSGSCQGDSAQRPNSQDQQADASDAQDPPPENSYSQTATEDLAKPGSPGWALPREVARSHGNEILRTIRVESRSDRFVLLPGDRRSSPEMFGVFDRNARRASLELATAIRDRVDHWGAALPGGRWQPVLEVDVKPGGEVRFQQLQMILQDSGVNVVPKKRLPKN
ncbi:hypothetical protein LF1_31460 [Rubripirellula obstinata]|uniref:IncA protein n=1 Tax=Rubripirellula obstinata TaxID=406547 RepID=A0A5B1CJ74_9BACT|nr:hypothetical protein [Rubripirellula obstinata]KAA1260606.1 hypothetical protein LF1_31460 [Rubripirellula obstinata]